MKLQNNPERRELFNRVKVMSNQMRFTILELTQDQEMSITELSLALNLAYTKCADYVKILENLKMVSKTKRGREVKVKSKVSFADDTIIFLSL